MKILNGLELLGGIKERQRRHAVLIQDSKGITPRVAIVQMGEHHVINKYAILKSAYGKDRGVKVDIYNTTSANILQKIASLNQDDKVHGIIIQLPLADPTVTDEALKAVKPVKDIDGLGGNSKYTPATVMAINWLLAGYDISLKGKKIAIIGKGKLVGAPLAKLWKNAGYDVAVCDTKTHDLAAVLRTANVIVTATGVPGLVTSDMIQTNTVVIDAGTAFKDGKIVGDLADDVRERQDLTITPITGGVGPLTVAALFENVITAAQKVANNKVKQTPR
jgi:methylenetetrahydrofolate dehydrogenase (NADP+)/methenyltetrahydrofolate cyclohydrolase